MSASDLYCRESSFESKLDDALVGLARAQTAIRESLKHQGAVTRAELNKMAQIKKAISDLDNLVKNGE